MIGKTTLYGLRVILNKDVYINERVLFPKEMLFIACIDNLVLYRDYDDPIRYTSYLFGEGKKYTVLDHAGTIAYLIKNITGMEEKNNVLYYKGNPLDSEYEQIDDDGNFYSRRTMYSDDKATIKIFSNDEVGTFRRYTQFDYEGNFWQIDFTQDEAKHPVLLYAGRTWGYKQAPRNATVTGDGLRLRLRASTKAYVLESLKKDDALTVLKTGELETIGGLTAPWYRVQTKDGLVGWVFGGFLEVE